MAEKGEKKEKVAKGSIEACAHVAQYGPYTVENLVPKTKYKWCTCGLSKKQPWCDGSHKGTPFRSLKFEIAEDKVQSKHSLCGCKHTETPPFCDGSHTSVPCMIKERIEKCPQKDEHSSDTQLCYGCGFAPDF